MIKTLRITSIIAAVLAAAFFVFPAVFGVRRDEEAEQFLKSPGVIEQFSKAEGQKKTKSESEVPPLVKQAEAFALYLNPPKPKESAEPAGTVESTHRPKTISPKFELIGTSFYATNPQLSLALIDEAGKGLRWVRQSSEVGHLIIEQIRDGAVVVRDGQRTFELVAERPRKINLVKGTFPISPDTTGTEVPPSSEAIEVRPEEVLAKLMAMKAEVESDANNLQYTGQESAMFDKLISEFKDMRITDQEGRKLEQLGEDLNDIQPGPESG